MDNNYLIPANSKKSLMIFGMFYTFDLILFGSGIGITLLLLMILPIGEIAVAIIAILPALITGLLVFPVPNYHNTLTVLIDLWEFLTTRQKFIWKGWCVKDGEKDQK
ncbi:hypothetical protein EGP64_03525 [bacterium]|nr:hypothetical protein [bacterium]